MQDATPAVVIPKATLAAGGRVAWSVVVGYVRLLCRVASVVAAGVAANWGFLALAAWQSGGSSRMAGIVALITFGLLFPIGYLVVGQKQGIQVLLQHCYQRHKESVIDFLLLVLQRVVVAGDGAENVIKPEIRAALKRVEETPWPIRFALKHFLHKHELQTLALEIVSDSDFRAGRVAAAKERYDGRINECILSTVLDVDKRWLWALAGMNVCAAAVAWFLLS